MSESGNNNENVVVRLKEKGHFSKRSKDCLFDSNDCENSSPLATGLSMTNPKDQYKPMSTEVSIWEVATVISDGSTIG
jgi:hypothetical protein